MRPLITFTAALATLLSSIGLYSLFAGAGWFWPITGAVLSVAVASLVVQRFRLPPVAGLVPPLALLFLFVTAVFASPEAYFGVIPTPASLARLGDLIGEGRRAAGKYAAPVPLGPGIEVLATIGVGLIAVAVDLLAVRLRRAAPAGLPLLAMYSVPAAVRDDNIGWPAFALGAIGYLALLLVDGKEQVSTWGRPVFNRRWSDDTPSERPDVAAVAIAGRKIGLAAVVVAVLLPSAIPGIHPRGIFGIGGRGAGVGGAQTVTTPDPLVSLKRELTRRDDSVVLTYRTDDSDRPDYLRLYALDRFDGDRWTYSALRSSAKDRIKDVPLPSPPGLGIAQTHAVTTSISVDGHVDGMTFLPVPYAPTRIGIKGDWRVHGPSLMIYSLRDSAAGRSYSVTSLRVQPSPEQLSEMSRLQPPHEITAQFLEVPRRVPDRVRRRAEAVTAGATSPYARAMKLQEWFTAPGRFTYDLSAQSPRNGSDLVDFLEVSRRGYCEQFAAAMAVMARTLGIPARVAMGYTGGIQGSDGRWTVRSSDAHAWPELYFEGAGWLRFEPTPSGPTGQGTASTPAYADPTPATARPGTGATTAPGTQDTPQARATSSPGAAGRHRPDQPAGSTDGGTPQGSGGSASPGVWVLLALLLLPAAAPGTVRVISRRRRWARVRTAGAPDPATGAAHIAWGELRADVIDHGLRWSPSETPRAAGRRLIEHLELSGPGAAALTRIVRAEERARYAPSRPVAVLAGSAVAPASPASMAARRSEGSGPLAGTPPVAPPGGDGPADPADPVEALRADSEAVRAALAGSVSRGSMWRARLVPPSSVAELSAAAGRAWRRVEEVAGGAARSVAAVRTRMARPKAASGGRRDTG